MSKELSKIFTKDFNEALVHQVTTDFLSNQRSGTKAQKNRSESAAVVPSLVLKKVQVEQEQEQHEVLFGEPVESHLQQNQKFTTKKLIRKCTEEHSTVFSTNC